MSKFLKFYSKSKYANELSNFSGLKVVIDDVVYKTGEHCFHGRKYLAAATLYTEDEKRKNKCNI